MTQSPVTPMVPTVSVILPIYNAARFLDQALLSVEEQTLPGIEILCINDGSTDASAQILKRHAKGDARIRVVNKPNGGYGQAMNRGLAEARGTWIAILEPDDWIEQTMFADLVSFAKSFDEPVDIVKSPYWRITDPDTPAQRKLNCSYKGRIKPASQPFDITDPGAQHLLHHHPSIWSALYRRTFLEEHGIRFHEIPGAGWADNPFLIDTLCQAKRIVYLDHAYYCYREETEEKTRSFTLNNTTTPLERWLDQVECLDAIGMTDEGVWRIQNERAFTYLGGIAKYVDVDREDVHPLMKQVFERMDADMVFADPEISPSWKERFARERGIAVPDLDAKPYFGHLVKQFGYNLVNIGPAKTFELVKSFL